MLLLDRLLLCFDFELLIWYCSSLLSYLQLLDVEANSLAVSTVIIIRDEKVCELSRGLWNSSRGNVNTRILFDIADNYLKQNPLY